MLESQKSFLCLVIEIEADSGPLGMLHTTTCVLCVHVRVSASVCECVYLCVFVCACVCVSVCGSDSACVSLFVSARARAIRARDSL